MEHTGFKMPDGTPDGITINLIYPKVTSIAKIEVYTTIDSVKTLEYKDHISKGDHACFMDLWNAIGKKIESQLLENNKFNPFGA